MEESRRQQIVQPPPIQPVIADDTVIILRI